MSMLLYVDSLPKGISAICQALREFPTIELFDEGEKIGYDVTLRLDDKAVADLTPQEFARQLRMIKDPQPYDIVLRPWSAWRYCGFHCGIQSSRF